MTDNVDNQIQVDRVERITCAKCGTAVDLTDVKPMTQIACPHCGAAVAVPGKIDQFMLTRLMGAGAMGAVFAATDTSLGRRVAIKIMQPQIGEDAKQAQLNFLQEARALAALNHRNVVHIHSIGRHRGQTYIVMELVDGTESLEKMLAVGQCLDEKRALEIGLDVARGLAAAANLRLIHGDIKPGNILLASDGSAKVVDFGLVRRAGKSEGDQPLWGTPYYIAPERVRGAAPDVPCDIYSLGATLWHLLTARPPFVGSSVKEVLSARLAALPPDIIELRPEISQTASHILDRMMAPDPAKRYANYATVIDRFESALKTLHAKTIARESRPKIQQAKRATFHRPAAASASVLRTHTQRRKKIGPNKFLLLTLFIVIVGAIVGGVAYIVSTRSSSTSQTDRADLAEFDGPALPPGWSAVGVGQFNQHGQYIIPAGNALGAPNGLRCDLPDGDFTCQIRLAPLKNFDVNTGRAELEWTAPSGDGLQLVITYSPQLKPDIRAIVKANGQTLKAADVDLPYSPEAISLNINWRQRFGEWSIQYGQDAAVAALKHPLGRISMPEPFAAPTQFQLHVYPASDASRPLAVGIDHFQVTPLD